MRWPASCRPLVVPSRSSPPTSPTRPTPARVAKRLSDDAKPVDILVNNAGYGLRTKLVTPDIAEHDAAYGVMVRAVWVLGAAVAPGMRDRGRGAIINVSSTAGQLSMGALLGHEGVGDGLQREPLERVARFGSDRHGPHAGLGAHRIPSAGQDPSRAAFRTPSGSTPNAWCAICLRDVDRGRVISIPSIRYRSLSWLLKHLPDRTVRWVSRRISLSRSKAATQ